MTRTLGALLIALVLLLAAGTPARDNKCASAKLKAVAKKEAGLLACQAKVAATGDASGLAACEAKVVGKFTVAFGKVGTCAGSQAQCEDIGDACDSAMASFLTATFPSKCEAAKRKAAGKLAGRELVCYAKAARKGTAVDTSCLTKARGKFGAALTKAGTCPDGGSPQNEVESSCVQTAVTTNGGLITDLCPTTTTTTTTTLPLLCGEGNPPACGGACPSFYTCMQQATTCGCVPVPPPCGVVGEPCCASATPCLSPGLVCASNGCVPCGGAGQPCCAGNTCGTGCCAENTCFSPCPFTCYSSQAPTCSGTCPSGQVCGQGSGSTTCVCVDTDDTCAISPAPTCGGTCPNSSDFCQQSSGGSSCACVCDPALPCPFVTEWGSSGSGAGQFNSPTFVAVDGSGNIFVADTFNDRIQKFTNTGTFLLTFGWGVQDGMVAFETCTSMCRAGIRGPGDGQFGGPFGVAVDGSGNVFVADNGNHRIQKFTNTGTFLLTFGWGVKDGAAVFETCTSACQAGLYGSGDGEFAAPQGLAVDGSGNVFVADYNNTRIQKFSNAGAFLTTWGSMGSGDAQFRYPVDVAVDGSGNVFVTEDLNNRVQKFTNTGSFLLRWGSPGVGDGQFNSPLGVVVDASGNVFVDDGNYRIQEFTNTGTFVKKWGCPGSGAGQFSGLSPWGLGVDGSTNVFVADYGNNRIQKFACP